MPRLSAIREDVLEHPELDGILDLCADLLSHLAAERINGQLAELDRTAERAQERLILDVIESLRDEDPCPMSKHTDHEVSNR